jgi:hypothetical protein
MTEKHKLSKFIDLVCQARDALSPKEQAVFDEMMADGIVRLGVVLESPAQRRHCVDGGVRSIKWACCCSRPRPMRC